MSELLRRSLGEQIAIETVLAGGLWRVHIDPNQLEIGILNLAVNARDAMPKGGKLTIETANAYLDESYATSQAEVVPGQYVVVSISDSGMGMSREVQSHAFEPFYTTKDIGQGTGLGLSQVYGFVKQSGGHVRLYSEEGHGTTVKLYLPRLLADDGAAAKEAAVEHAPRSRSGETILVVEDDEDVRAHSTGILRELGYVVLVAPAAAAALQILEQHPEIELLFTDVGLPGGMNGRQLADEARKLRPDLKVLFTTGYARNAIVHDGRLDPGVSLLTKPFTFAALAAKLDDLLGGTAGSARVLLVEDEILVQMVAADQLRDLGYRVETAGSATEAINKARLLGRDIAFAVVDIGLPDRRGDGLVGELRALHSQLPIIVASGYDSDDLLRRYAADRRIVLLRKPYLPEELRAAVIRLSGC
jgi:CheY-like chemotaxis protein